MTDTHAATMHTIHTDLDIRWLTAPDPLGPATGTSARWVAPFPEGQGHGWMEREDLDIGVHLCRVVHHFAPGQSGLRPMSEVCAQLTEPAFFVQTTRRGGGVLYDRGLDLRLAHTAGAGIFQHLDRVDHQHWADAAAPLEITAMDIGLSRLQGFVGEATARALLAALTLTERPAAHVRPLPRPLTALLESALGDTLTGPLRRLHAQARVLDFLVALAIHLRGADPPAACPVTRLQQVREELDQCQGTVPCLETLARHYGFSVRALNERFKQAFGQTLYAYVTDQRLVAAQALLMEDHPPLKQVAARLGYASVSHFSQVFTRKFGVRPGSVRRRATR